MLYVEPSVLQEAVQQLNRYNPNTFLLLVFSNQKLDWGEDIGGGTEVISRVYNELFAPDHVEYPDPNGNLFVQVSLGDKATPTPTVRMRTTKDYGGAYQRSIKDTFANGKFLVRTGKGIYKPKEDFVEQVREYLGSERIDLYPLIIFENWNSIPTETTRVRDLWGPFLRRYGLDKFPFDDIFQCSNLDSVVSTTSTAYRFQNYIRIDDNRSKERIAIPAEVVETPGRRTKTQSIIGLHNKIVYGAPGTGKSRFVDDSSNGFSQFSRVTFYPDYTYSQFVGGYRPRSLYDNYPMIVGATGIEVYQTITPIASERPYGRRPVIDYTVVPGPFLSLLVQAYKYADQNYLLIIEEINRANAAAVFGDVFQLLDRDDDGVSEYAVTLSAELSNWLRGQGIEPDGELVEALGDGLSVRLPGNFYIWATMNSADQGVLPLDSAFKRRWSFEYVPLNKGQDVIADWTIKLLGREVSWDGLRQVLNDFLMSRSTGGRSLVSEDKLLGPFFMKRQELNDDRVVLNKLLLYLRDDLVRHNANVVFAADALHFSAVYDKYTTILSSYNPTTDSRDKFSQDLSKLFTPALAERLALLVSEPAA